MIVSPRAQQEFRDALNYYDNIDHKLGMRLIAELSATYKALEAAPQFYSFVFSRRKTNVRDVKLKSFPYLVFYEIKGNLVMVIALMHAKRKPFIK